MSESLFQTISLVLAFVVETFFSFDKKKFPGSANTYLSKTVLLYLILVLSVDIENMSRI